MQQVRILSKAERRVTDLFIRGLSQKQIAERLRVSRHTVHTHLKNIYQTLGIHSETEYTRYALLQKIRDLRTALMKAETNAEINLIILADADLIEEVPGLWKMVKLARNRIRRLRKETLLNTELIFKN
jgi:DNA-binding CsgD family transcriptional regulator